MATKAELIRLINERAQVYCDYPVSEAGLSGKSKAWLENRLAQLQSACSAKFAAGAIRDKYTANQWLAASMGYADTGIPYEDRVERARLAYLSDHLWWGMDYAEAKSKADALIAQGYGY